MRILWNSWRQNFLFVAIMAASFASHALGEKPNYPGSDEWEMTFYDNFDGTTLDETKWSRDQNDRYEASFVSVGGGTLNLKVDRDPLNPYKHKAARVDNTKRLDNMDNKFDQLYGFFECRALAPKTEQTMFAFWLQSWPWQGLVDGTGHDGAEIDVVETMYKDEAIQSTLHFDGYTTNHLQRDSGKVPAPGLNNGGYHTYGLEWDKDNLKFYFDGKMTYHYRGVGIPWVRSFMLLTSETMLPIIEGNIKNAALPVYAKVDYVRVWKKKSNTSTNPAIGQIFKPLDDSYVRDGGYSGLNFGTEPTMMVKSDAVGYNRQSFMKFKFDQYVGSKPASQAKLRLFVNNVNTDANRSVKVYGVGEGWAESSITANNDPTGGTLLGTLNIPSSGANKWFEIDVSKYVYGQMSDRIAAFRLVNEGPASGTSNVSFNTKEALTGQPELRLISDTVNVIASADAYIRKGTYSNTNYGSDPVLTVKSSRDLPDYARAAFLKFNFGDYRANSISLAQLRLTVASVGTDPTRTIRVYAVKDEAWSETGITANKVPSGFTYLGSLTVTNVTGANYYLNVTDYIKANPDKIVSFYLINEGASTEQNIVSFHSRNATTINKPRLMIAP